MNTTLFRVLAVLGDGPRDATGILEELRLVGGSDVVPSVPALYRHLKRAMDRAWVEVEGVEDDLEGPGRPARSYALTEGGRAAVREAARRLERFTRLAPDPESGLT